jgi:hypothetical protein
LFDAKTRQIGAFSDYRPECLLQLLYLCLRLDRATVAMYGMGSNAGYTLLIRGEDGSKTDRRKEPSPGRLQMSIFGEKSSLGVLLRLTRQGHALGDEDAHLPFFK